MHRQLGIWLLVAIMLLVAGCGSAASNDGVQEGAQLPDAEFTTFAGETIRVADLRGQPVVINFWATWCGPCKEELPLLQQAFEDHNRTAFQLLAITDELPSEVRTFMGEHRMTFPVLFDRNGRVSKRYHIQGIPTTFFVNKDGVVIARHLGSLDATDLEAYLNQIIDQPAVPTPATQPSAPPKPDDNGVGQHVPSHST